MDYNHFCGGASCSLAQPVRWPREAFRPFLPFFLYLSFSSSVGCLCPLRPSRRPPSLLPASFPSSSPHQQTNLTLNVRRMAACAQLPCLLPAAPSLLLHSGFPPPSTVRLICMVEQSWFASFHNPHPQEGRRKNKPQLQSQTTGLPKMNSPAKKTLHSDLWHGIATFATHFKPESPS